MSVSLSIRQHNSMGLKSYCIYKNDRLVCTLAPWISKEVAVAVRHTIETFNSLGKKLR